MLVQSSTLLDSGADLVAAIYPIRLTGKIKEIFKTVS